MPPSVVLEVLRILRDEVDLRDLTRGTEQQREAVLPHRYERDAGALTESQEGLRRRTQDVIDQLTELQITEEKNYGQPIAQLGKARDAMVDAVALLATPDTGAPAIAAETEAIEWLLLTKKAGKGGGGGGGGVPGGSTAGGTTDLAASALAGIGDGVEAKPRLVHQATGNVQTTHPEEFQAGLDAYFGSLERGE